MSINVTSHSASSAPPIHVIHIIPFVIGQVIIFIIPVIPSLFNTLSFWLGTISTESKGIAALANQELDDIGFAIVSIDRMPINVTGHFNDIFLGQHASFGQVALRRPRISESNYRDTIRRFQRETKTWRSLDHPRILPLLGIFTRDEHIYFVSPFAENGCLLEYIVDHPRVNRIPLLSGIADAIAYLHNNEIVHGDIKAGNVLINGHGYPLLCDFGLAKMPYCKTSTERKGAGTVRWQVRNSGTTSRDRSPPTRDVPFGHLHSEVAVIKAVLTCDERPFMTPQASPSGISYENAWSVAKSCWPTLPQDRISMTKALQRLQADPSLATESSDTSPEPDLEDPLITDGA
ncbi:hypothetical protein M407DRAFT_27476 [Tulasnella calospora MUT 4182]|uniref:Protein kinase domain-containing protein n=1 Tax=Tulasnella calospora MUT 4182 TaxID=1051891 RepID=A0A0C3LNR4_9AGAM|nr:hypothetical protein M407DRAFT_27476 [Tulasnella calospora MUT 4182]